MLNIQLMGCMAKRMEVLKNLESVFKVLGFAHSPQAITLNRARTWHPIKLSQYKYMVGQMLQTVTNRYFTEKL